MMKKFLSALLTFTMLISLVCLPSYAVLVDNVQLSENFEAGTELPSNWSVIGGTAAIVTDTDSIKNSTSADPRTHGNVLQFKGNAGQYVKVLNTVNGGDNVTNYIEISVKTDKAMDISMLSGESVIPLIGIQAPSSSTGKSKVVVYKSTTNPASTGTIYSDYVPGSWLRLKFTLKFKYESNKQVCNVQNKQYVTESNGKATTKDSSNMTVNIKEKEAVVNNLCIVSQSESATINIDELRIYNQVEGSLAPVPEVSIVSPTEALVVKEGEAFNLTVGATIADDTIADVSFFEKGNGTPIASGCTFEDGKATYTVNGAKQGIHYYYATATGSLGGVGTSELWTVVVTTGKDYGNDYVMMDADFTGTALPQRWTTVGDGVAAMSDGVVTVSGIEGDGLRFDNQIPKDNVINTVEYRLQPQGEMKIWMVNPSVSSIKPTLLTFSEDSIKAVNRRYTNDEEITEDLLPYVSGHWYRISYTIDFTKDGGASKDLLTVTIKDETTGESAQKTVYTRNTDEAVHNHVFQLTGDGSFLLDDFKLYEKDGGTFVPYPSVKWSTASAVTCIRGESLTLKANLSVLGEDVVVSAELYLQSRRPSGLRKTMS